MYFDEVVHINPLTYPPFPFLAHCRISSFRLSVGVVAQMEAWRRCAETRLGLGLGQGSREGQERGQDLRNNDNHPTSTTATTATVSLEHEHDDDDQLWRVRGPGELSLLCRLGRATAADHNTPFHTRLNYPQERSTSTGLGIEEEDDEFHYQMTTSTPVSSTAIHGSTLLKSPSQQKKERQQTNNRGHSRGHSKGRRGKGKGHNNLWDHLLNHGKGRHQTTSSSSSSSSDVKEGQDTDAPWGDLHRYVFTPLLYTLE